MMKKSASSLISLLTLALIFCSCSSLNKKAAQLMEGGAYEEAARLYEQALRKKPSDAEATLGLKKAREKVIDTQLIQVRLSRIAGNDQNALDLLLKVVQNENQWKYSPMGKVEFTQEEESQYAIEFVSKKVEKSNFEGFPLSSYVFLKKYRPLFTGRMLNRHTMLSAKTKESGESQCRKLLALKGERKPYFSIFVNKFCDLWGVEVSEFGSNIDEVSKELFKDVAVSFQVKGVSEALIPSFQESFRESLRRSPWYDPHGKNEVELNLSGSFVQNHRSQTIAQVHNYTVEVPYTAYETQTRSRQVPVVTNRYQCSNSPSTVRSVSDCRWVPVTEYKTDYYKENVPVTRYRSESRSQNYEATKHYQFLSFMSKGDLSLGKNSRAISMTEKLEKDTIEHDWSMPAIGLYPKKLSLPDPHSWLKSQISSYSSKFEQSLSELWDSLYCKPVQGTSLALTGEQVQRCLKNHHSTPPEFVKQWFDTKLGISIEEANEIIDMSAH